MPTRALKMQCDDLYKHPYHGWLMFGERMFQRIREICGDVK